MNVLKIDSAQFQCDDLQSVASALNGGGVIAYPTETVYGLGANIFKANAVARIFTIKGRDPQKPISIMISRLADVDEFCDEVPAAAKILMKHYWPGPLTLILKASPALPDYIVSSDKKIGLRFPDHPICSALMRLHADPVTSTSANLTGLPPLARVEEIVEAFGEKLDVIIDCGECAFNQPSTVVDVSGPELRILREGTVAANEIFKLILELEK
jgi:L-threonylcarbamoyladenylate synthase